MPCYSNVTEPRAKSVLVGDYLFRSYSQSIQTQLILNQIQLCYFLSSFSNVFIPQYHSEQAGPEMLTDYQRLRDLYFEVRIVIRSNSTGGTGF